MKGSLKLRWESVTRRRERTEAAEKDEGKAAEKYALTPIESRIVFNTVYNRKSELRDKSDIKWASTHSTQHHRDEGFSMDV